MDNFSSKTSLCINPLIYDLRKSPSVLNCFIFLNKKAIVTKVLKDFFNCWNFFLFINVTEGFKVYYFSEWINFMLKEWLWSGWDFLLVKSRLALPDDLASLCSGAVFTHQALLPLPWTALSPTASLQRKWGQWQALSEAAPKQDSRGGRILHSGLCSPFWPGHCSSSTESCLFVLMVWQHEHWPTTPDLPFCRSNLWLLFYYEK